MSMWLDIYNFRIIDSTSVKPDAFELARNMSMFSHAFCVISLCLPYVCTFKDTSHNLIYIPYFLVNISYLIMI